MIILVKVNKTYTPGNSIKKAAYRAWNYTSLLNNAELRNKYKYLVAYYYGNIIGTFCIHGISPDSLGSNRVKFLLADTDKDCDIAIRNIFDTIKGLDPERLTARRPWLKFDCDYLQGLKIDCKLKCSCWKEYIPLLEPSEIVVEKE